MPHVALELFWEALRLAQSEPENQSPENSNQETKLFLPSSTPSAKSAAHVRKPVLMRSPRPGTTIGIESVDAASCATDEQTYPGAAKLWWGGWWAKGACKS